MQGNANGVPGDWLDDLMVGKALGIVAQFWSLARSYSVEWSR